MPDDGAHRLWTMRAGRLDDHPRGAAAAAHPLVLALAVDVASTSSLGQVQGGGDVNGTELSIREVARVTGTTSRTLRHYESVGVLLASRVGPGGLRYYDDEALVRLQRILVLRDLGMHLADVGRLLDDGGGLDALRQHLHQLRTEQQRLARMVASVERTIVTLEEGGQLVAEEMFDGFDHTHYKDEVEERWGKDAYTSSDAWYRGMSEAGRRTWKDSMAQLGADWIAAARSGIAPDSDEAQALARRHADWLAGIPGTPGHGTGAPAKEYLLGLGEMYVADPRFAANYGGEQGATFVRDALRVYAESRLPVGGCRPTRAAHPLPNGTTTGSGPGVSARARPRLPVTDDQPATGSLTRCRSAVHP